MTPAGPNPYQALDVAGPPPVTGPAQPRAPIAMIVALTTGAAYGLAGLGGAVIGVLALLWSPDPMRPDEFAVLTLSVLFAPVALVFSRREFLHARSMSDCQERRLSVISMAATLGPLTAAAFWFYEYVAFGFFEANAIPAILALVFAACWFAVSLVRFRRVSR